jgi:hypothetical protein
LILWEQIWWQSHYEVTGIYHSELHNRNALIAGASWCLHTF